MAPLNWDNIEIIAEDESIVRITDWSRVEIVSEDGDLIKTCDNDVYNIEACDRMIVFSGQPGADGPQGPAATIQVGTVTTLPAGSDATVVNRGTPEAAIFDFGIPKGEDGASEWGDIGGTLSDQTDLQNTLNAKANTADLGTMSAESASDYYTKTATDALLQEKADIIHTSASGALVHLTDGAPYPVTALSVGIEPVQDLHGYSNPWPAGGGKNLYNASLLSSNNGITVSVSNGKVTLNGTAGTGNAWLPVSGLGLPSGNYMFSCGNTSTNSGVHISFRDSGGNYFNDNALSSTNKIVSITSKDVNSVVFYVAAGTSLTDFVLQPQLETGTSATSWSPYENICPISGHTSAVVTRTGINIWDEEWENGAIKWSSGDNDDGSAYQNRIRSKNYIAVKSGATYYLKFAGETNLFLYNESKQWVNSVYIGSAQTYTIPSGIYYIRFNPYASYGATYLNNLGINYPSTDHNYHAGHVQTLTIDLDGTRYGGTLNVLTGEMTVDMAFWTKNTSTMNNNENYPGWSNAGVRDIIGPNKVSIIGTISNISGKVGSSGSGTNYFGVNTNSTNDILYLPKERWGDKRQTQWIAEAIDIQLVIPLATPLTVQLTPSTTLETLKGDNAIWASTGNTSVTYRADTKLFIERLTKPTEDDMTANSNISSGKYFMVGNSLFKSTASIASGEAIVPGTNCTAMSLADALNQLA